MKRCSVMKMLVPWFVLFAVTGCGPLSLTDGNNDLAGGGIGGTGISVGKITAAGGTSVDVNGVAFDITVATVTMDGMPGLQNDLKVGMIVKIDGTFYQDGSTGVAASIEFKDNLEGTVDSVDPASNAIIVLGQTVNLSGTTHFDDDFTDTNGDGLIDVDDIIVGNVVEVSGLVDADGIIHASYISLKSDMFGSDGAGIELKGTITYDQNTGTFAIRSLTIDFSSAGLEDIAVNAANNGLYVEVKSTSAPVNNVFIASSIEIEDEGHEADEGDRIEIEGYVTDVTGIAPDISFVVKGHIVQVNTDTIFENGSVDNIKPNTKVEVKGTVDAYGVLVADKIEIKSADDRSHEDSGSNDSGTDDSTDNSDGDSRDDSSDTDGEDAAK